MHLISSMFPRRDRRRLTALSGVLAALVIAVLPASVAGAAAESDTDSTPNQHVIVRALDRCSGEPATFDVTFHSLIHESTDAAGGTHRVLLIQGQRVTGLSDSGVVYSAGKSFGPTIEHELASGTEVFTDIVIVRLITQGSEDNRVVQATFHTTVTPDGEVISSVEKFDVACRG